MEAVVCFGVLGLLLVGTVLVVVLAGRRLMEQKASSSLAATRNIEFMTNASPEVIAAAIRADIDGRDGGFGGFMTRVTSASTLGVVIQNEKKSGPLGALHAWEIRVDFEQHAPLVGRIYMYTFGGTQDIVNKAEQANAVMDRVVAVIRQVDPAAQVHGR